MKFRTGFVTNSSSYSTAEVKIDNPVLLAILKKYKEVGVFDHIEFFKDYIGEAFDLYEDEVADDAEECPDKLENVVNSLFSMIDYFSDNMTDSELCTYKKNEG